MNSRMISNLKSMGGAQAQRTAPQRQITQKSSPSSHSSQRPPLAKDGMIKRTPARSSEYSASEIRSKLQEHLAPAKKSSPQQTKKSAPQKKAQNGEQMKKEANDKAKEDVKNGVEVRKPTVQSNDPKNSNTHEKIKDAINNNLVDFSPRERDALSNILSEKDS